MIGSTAVFDEGTMNPIFLQVDKSGGRDIAAVLITIVGYVESRNRREEQRGGIVRYILVVRSSLLQWLRSSRAQIIAEAVPRPPRELALWAFL